MNRNSLSRTAALLWAGALVAVAIPASAQAPSGNAAGEAWIRSLIQRFDTDGDGRLNTVELQVVRSALANLPPAAVAPDTPRPAPGSWDPDAILRAYDRNGDGRLDAAERRAAKLQLLRRYDRNGDGRLDRNERNAAQAAISSLQAVAVPAQKGRGTILPATPGGTPPPEPGGKVRDRERKKNKRFMEPVRTKRPAESRTRRAGESRTKRPARPGPPDYDDD